MGKLTGDLRRGTPSRWPHELTVITDPDDKEYDKRETNVIDPAAVLNLATVGQIQPLSVRLLGNRLVLTDGLQRTKRALVINHLNGSFPYKGDCEAVQACIKAMTGTPMGKRVVEECPRGLKLQIVVFRGDERQAYGAKASANEFRQDDPMGFKIEKAQRLMNKFNYSPQEVAEAMNVSVATVNRWKNVDLSKPRAAPKKRGKATRPSRAVVEKAFEHIKGKMNQTLLGWVLGKVKSEELFTHFPELKPEDNEAAA